MFPFCYSYFLFIGLEFIGQSILFSLGRLRTYKEIEKKTHIGIWSIVIIIYH